MVALYAAQSLCLPLGTTGCGFESFNRLKGILATCCESTKATDCSAGFPQTCTLACGKLLIPFYNDCNDMIAIMPPSNFKFGVKDMQSFVHACEHTQELYHFSTATCAATPKAKEERALDVSAACCSQKGANVCDHSVPWKCTPPNSSLLVVKSSYNFPGLLYLRTRAADTDALSYGGWYCR